VPRGTRWEKGRRERESGGLVRQEGGEVRELINRGIGKKI